MFTNKKDPLVDAVKSVMYEGNLKRQVEEAVNNHFGVSSRKAIPHEHLAEYDDLLSESYKQAIEEGSTPRNKKEAKLAAMKEPRHEITHADVLKGRGVIKQEETQLDEKAVSKAQHRFFGLVRGIQKGKAKGSAKAEKAAKEMSAKEVRKFAKTKEKGLPERVDESIESIMEEIRVNLEEQLVAVYESGDEQMFEEFVSSLTEEQIELLGLNEIYGALAARAAATPIGQRAIGAISNLAQRGMSAIRGSATPPPAIGGALKSTPSPAPLALPKPPGTAVATIPPAPVAVPPLATGASGMRAAGVAAAGIAAAGVTRSSRPSTPTVTQSQETDARVDAQNAERQQAEKAKQLQKEIPGLGRSDARDTRTSSNVSGSTPSTPTATPKSSAPAATPASKPKQPDDRQIAGFAPNVPSGQPGGSKWGNTFQESTHLKESLESIMEEIRVNLEEQLVAVYESGDEQMFEEFVSSLTEEQLEILGLNEDWRGALASTGGFDFGGGGYQTPSRVAAAQARGAARSAARPSAAPAPAARPSPAPAARPSAAPAPASAPKPQYGPRQSPSDMGAPPAGSPQYQGAKAAGRADLTEPAKSKPAIPSTAAASDSALKSAGSVARAQQTAPAAANADLTDRPRPAATPRNHGQSIDDKLRSLPGDQAAQSRQETGGRLGAEIPESYHLKESLESFIRNKFIKG